MPEPWESPLVRLGGGQVLLRGSALLDVLRALDVAQRVAARDGISPPREWLRLRDELAVAAECIRPGATAAAGSRLRMGSAADGVIGRVDLTDPVDSKEAAQMLGTRARNVRDLHTRGVLVSGRLVGGRLLLERAEIEAEVHRRAEARCNKERRAHA